MKTIRNKTHAPIRVNFSGGKVLHLGPLKSGQVPDQALETASVRKLLAAGTIEVVREGAQVTEGGVADGAAHGSSRGHPHATRVAPKGNRGG